MPVSAPAAVPLVTCSLETPATSAACAAWVCCILKASEVESNSVPAIGLPCSSNKVLDSGICGKFVPVKSPAAILCACSPVA